MKTVEKFMSEFFGARIAEEKRFQEDRLPFRRKYFAEDCRYDSHDGTLQMMDSEKIVSVESGKNGSMVITDQIFHYSRGIQTIRLRYHLLAVGDDWLIQDVQRACFCEGRGDSSCPVCKGKHWI